MFAEHIIIVFECVHTPMRVDGDSDNTGDEWTMYIKYS